MTRSQELIERIAKAIYIGRRNKHRLRPVGRWDRERENEIARCGAESFDRKIGLMLHRSKEIVL